MARGPAPTGEATSVLDVNRSSVAARMSFALMERAAASDIEGGHDRGSSGSQESAGTLNQRRDRGAFKATRAGQGKDGEVRGPGHAHLGIGHRGAAQGPAAARWSSSTTAGWTAPSTGRAISRWPFHGCPLSSTTTSWTAWWRFGKKNEFLRVEELAESLAESLAGEATLKPGVRLSSSATGPDTR